MEYSYTFANFFHILLCTAGLAVIIPLCILAPLSTHNPRLRRIALAAAVTGTTALALHTVCPWVFFREMLFPFQLLFIPSGLYLAYTLSRSYRNRKIEDYSSWIIDTLREKIIIFDKDMRTISCGKTGLPAQWFPYGSRPELPETDSDTDFSLLAALMKKPVKSSGSFSWRGTDLSYRLIPIEKGYLLILLDISEETTLLKELRMKNIQLENSRRSIEQLEEKRLKEEQEQYRNRVSSRINRTVSENLVALLADIETVAASGNNPEKDKIHTMLKHAEESMSSIRSMVRRLASE